jgi:hypothetical protein
MTRHKSIVPVEKILLDACPAPVGCCNSELGEQVLVQALVAQATIERFDEAVLLRLPRGDVVPLDAGVLTPGEDGMTGQFGAIVADHHARQPATLGDGGEFADDTPAGLSGISCAGGHIG